ncbi:E3 ubiquitin-protein ligase RNF168-like isoform X2 [Dendronephthya gigantea]|uniref:E3 ubiquitin-protein ligase RNF168-like isoform X2 n=1 Tax=Dendronephthya gigantea TaxID=151771 RepID=UPI001069C2B2|nr:E3 ubiquitin-protein ligase RNF168-like isoform X2 [Dendronephthya gigantea]
MASKNKSSVSDISEYRCSICLQLLVEPVVLPCKHEMCRSCFCQNVEEGNFLCPICRKRVSTWARKCIREGTLIDEKRWNLIQELFPRRCLKRLQGDDDETDDEYQPPTKRVLAKSGELRKEYEQEMNKVLQLQKEEEQASHNLINNLIKEEKALLQQEKEDEQLAKKLNEELKNTKEDDDVISNLRKNSDDTSKMKSKDLKRKKVNSKRQGKSYTLDKYFSNNNHSGNSPPSEPRHNSDFEFAMALQKKFDKEALVLNSKREDYMLRKTTGNHKNRATQNSHESESYKQKNGHTCTHQARLGEDALYVKVKNPVLDEEEIKVADQQSKEPRILRERKKIEDTMN